ncbi:bcl2-associated agonist of cell death-like [Megalops cyprinoides]|uniref:bcl2-associated agonist of cell death-like n=1 Tax=Megalops cyprinoides TaxID=118141 RepID=UPI0018643D4E|nr:bcl2-associated agonist of cell death-like [Megalops cyprinoides]
MADMYISDNESETSDDIAESGQSGGKRGAGPAYTLNVPDLILPGEPPGRQRLLSDSQASLVSQGDEGEPHDGMVSEEGGEGAPFRGRSRSAPPELWAAKRYGRQLRRMSDEFDSWLDKGKMKRVQSAGVARQMRLSPSWLGQLAQLFSHRESEAEISSSFTGTDSRAAK